MAPTKKPGRKIFRNNKKKPVNLLPGSPSVKLQGVTKKAKKIKKTPTLKTRPVAKKSNGKLERTITFKDLETWRVVVKLEVDRQSPGPEPTVRDLLQSGPDVMGVQSKRAKELLKPWIRVSFFVKTATRPALLLLDNRKPIAEMSEDQVLDLHPRPSEEVRKALRELGCRLEDARTKPGRARLMRYWVRMSLAMAIHEELEEDFAVSQETMMEKLRSRNPQAIMSENVVRERMRREKYNFKKGGKFDKKEGVKKEGVEKDGVKKDGVKKDGVKKDGFKKVGGKKVGGKKESGKKVDGKKVDGKKVVKKEGGKK